MRHDPASAAIIVMLRGLKMYGMSQAVGDLVEQGAPAFEAAIPLLAQLLKAEMAEREVRSVAYQIKAARFPAYKDLTGFDFAASEVNEAMVRTLHGGDFIDGAHNVVLIGGPGTGKTHVATALCQRRSKSRPAERSKTRPVDRARRHGKGPDRGPFHVGEDFRSGGRDLAGVGVDAFGGGLVLLCPDRRAPPPDGLLEAVAVAVHGQDADVVSEPVQQGAGEPL